MAASTIDRECSPDVLALFMQEIIVEYNSYQKLVRRSEPREPVAIPVLATPVDADLNAAGEPFHAVTRDISHGGAGLFHTRRIDCRWLELTFSSPHSGQEMTILAVVEHCTPCGQYFILGCRFGAQAHDFEPECGAYCRSSANAPDLA